MQHSSTANKNSCNKMAHNKYAGKGKSVTTLLTFRDETQKVYTLSRLGTDLKTLEQKFKELLVEKRIVTGNVFLNEGINLLWTLACGGTGTPLNNANAHIGVGDGNDEESPLQTGLLGTNVCYKPMDTNFPVYGENQKATFRSSFGSQDANFNWNEWTVANGNSNGAININRKVENFGEKQEGYTRILQLDLYIE